MWKSRPFRYLALHNKTVCLVSTWETRIYFELAARIKDNTLPYYVISFYINKDPYTLTK